MLYGKPPVEATEDELDAEVLTGLAELVLVLLALYVGDTMLDGRPPVDPACDWW